MIVNCPECQTRYVVDPAKLRAAGRAVRCARCGGTWHQTPPDDWAPEPPPPVAKPIADLPRTPPSFSDSPVAPMSATIGDLSPTHRFHPPAISEPKSRKLPRWSGWAALVAVLVLIPVGLILAQGPLTKVWPAMTRLYHAAGLSKDDGKIVLDLINTEVKPSRPSPDQPAVFIVSGDVKNSTTTVRAVPKLRVIFRASDKKIVHQEDFATEKNSLQPGEQTHYELTVPEQPTAATTEVTFVAG